MQKTGLESYHVESGGSKPCSDNRSQGAVQRLLQRRPGAFRSGSIRLQ